LGFKGLSADYADGRRFRIKNFTTCLSLVWKHSCKPNNLKALISGKLRELKFFYINKILLR